MNFRLVETGWDVEFDRAAKACRTALRIVTPFLQPDAVRRLLVRRPTELAVITRFSLDEFFRGVSSLEALRNLLEAGAEIKGVRHLHAKAYLFDDDRAIVTSGNLTNAALVRNHELGFVVSEPAMVAECRRYFDDLWGRVGDVLTPAWLNKMERKLATARAGGVNVSSTGLGDEGAPVGYVPAVAVLPGGFALGAEGYVKFSGLGDRRSELSSDTLAEVDGSGMHWACCYPAGKAPRQPQEGDTMFLAQLTHSPAGNDITIYGRAVAKRAHDGARDVANAAEKRRRDFKNKWPLYIRVHGAEFVAGTLANGVSLKRLMETFGAFSFASTERRALGGEKNVVPSRSLARKAAVHLSQRAKTWINGQLEAAFASHGTLTKAQLDTLDWPGTERYTTLQDG